MKLTKSWLIATFAILLTGFLYSQLTPSPIPPNPGGIANGVLLGDPRTPISSIPFTIRKCGSYFLTGCFTGVAGMDGITIEANDVTIDLMGFTLEGVPGSMNGIRTLPGRENTVIRNGTVREWGVMGINLDDTSGNRVEGIHLIGNNDSGLVLGRNSLALNCSASDNSTGFRSGNSAQGPGSSFINCTSWSNSVFGFRGFGHGVYSRCIAKENGSDGFIGSVADVVDSCVSYANGGAGIDGGSSTIRGCRVANNGSDGIIVNGALVQGNAVIDNTGAGINVTGASTVIENHVR